MAVKNPGLIYKPHNEKDHKADGLTVGGLSITKSYPPSISKDLHQFENVISGESGEAQSNRYIDTFSCVLYAILKAISTYAKKMGYPGLWDFSESYQAVLAGVKPGVGTSVRAGMESVRIWKCLEEQYRKFTKETTQSEFFAAVTFIQKELARNGILKDFDFHWDVIDDSSNVPHWKIIKNFEFTVAVLTGRAWIFNNEKGVYVDEREQANHCFLGVGYNEDHKYGDIIVDDSYRFNWNEDKEDHKDLNEFKKLLSKDFRIWSAHRCWLTPKDKTKISLITKLKNMILKTIKMNFFVNKDLPADKLNAPGNRANGEVYITKENPKRRKKVQTINDAIAMFESALAEMGVFIDKSDWPELSQYQEVDKF